MFKSLFAKYPIIIQFLRFVIVGFINTAIDFGVFNLLMWFFNIYSGQLIFLFNTAAFGTATVNSFFWNKHWTFKSHQNQKSVSQFGQFIFVSIIGAIINSAVVYALTTYVTPFNGLSQELWANLAKAAATALSLIWNFIGYKFLVFKK